MATLTQNETFTSTISAAKLNNIAGTATVTSIVNDDIASNAAIVDTKLATISTAGKVNATALTISGQTTGDILYYTGSTWARLAIGTAGQVLTVTGGLPVWAAA